MPAVRGGSEESMRDIDEVIDFVKASDRFSPVHTQVIINRLNPPPTQRELDEARRQVNAGQETLGVG